MLHNRTYFRQKSNKITHSKYIKKRLENDRVSNHTCCIKPGVSTVPWKILMILSTTLGFSKSVELRQWNKMLIKLSSFSLDMKILSRFISIVKKENENGCKACCGLNLVSVQNVWNWFNFYFFFVMYIRLYQSGTMVNKIETS